MAFFKKFLGDWKTNNGSPEELETWLENREDILRDTDLRMFEMEHWLGHISPKMHSLRVRADEIRKLAIPENGQNDLAVYKKCVNKMTKASHKLKRQELDLFKSCENLFANQFSHMSMWLQQRGQLEDARIAKLWEGARSNAQWCKLYVNGKRQEDEMDKWRRLAWLNHLFKTTLADAGYRMDRSAVEHFLGKKMTEPVGECVKY